jgi:hypothetical protein
LLSFQLQLSNQAEAEEVEAAVEHIERREHRAARRQQEEEFHARMRSVQVLARGDVVI